MSRSTETKIVLIGAEGVGKTSLVHQLIFGDITAPLGTMTGSFRLGATPVTVKFIEIPGSELAKGNILRARVHCRTAAAVVFVYDVSREATFQVLLQLFGTIRSVNSSARLALVGNKTDLKKAKVKRAQADEAAKLHGVSFTFELSATDRLAVTTLFRKLLLEVFPSADRTGELVVTSGCTDAHLKAAAEQAVDAEEGAVREIRAFTWRDLLLCCFRRAEKVPVDG
eukprot:RCo042332